MAGKVAPVTLALKGEGISELKGALRGVKAAFVEMERDSLAASKAASKERLALLRSESKEKVGLLRDESKARREILASEASFKRAVSRKEGEQGLGAAGKALVKGESFEGVMRAAGAAGIAVVAFAGALHFASASLKQFASFVVNDVIKPGLELQTRSQQVANNSGGALTAKDVESKARAIGIRNNMNPMDVIEATGRFQDLTGEPALGFGIMGTVASISKGRGYDTKSLAELGAAAYRPGMKEKDLSQLLLTLTGQGEKGSIPIGELARLGGRLTAPAEKMGGDWFTKVTTANALLQTAKRTGFGTVEDAATGLQNFTQEALLKGKGLSPKSFATVNGVDTITDPVKYLGDIYRKTRGAAAALHGYGFSEPSQKFIGAYQGVFSEGYKGAKDAGRNETQARDAGAKAVEDFVNAMKTTTSTLEAEDTRRDSVMATSGERFASGLERIKSSLLDSVMPGTEKLAESFVAHADEIARAGVLLATMLGDMAEAAISVVEWWDRLVNNKGEGDTLKTVVDKGAATSLPRMEDKGYWLHEKGAYRFIKGSEDANVDDAANKGLHAMKGGNPWERPSGRGVYERDNEKTPLDVTKITSLIAGPNASEMNQSVDTSTTEADAQEEQASTQAADAHEELATNASEASDAVCKLTSCVQDLTASLGELNRSQSFTRR